MTIQEINEFVNDWLYDHDFDIEAKMGTSFMVDLATNVLYYTPIYYDELDAILLEEITKSFPFAKNWDRNIMFLVSFFHEVGHVETECEWTKKDFANFFLWKVSNSAEMERNPSTSTVVEYFRHPIEWRATEWACEYIDKNWEEVGAFGQRLVELLQEFYQED